MPVPNCVVRNKLSTSACVECKTSHYCSIDWVKKDQPVHQMFCSQLATFVANTPRPASKVIRPDTALDGDEGVIYRRGLLFLVDSKDPQYVWVKCTQTFYASDGHISEQADIREFLKSGLGMIEIKTNRNVVMDHSVTIWYRDEYLVDGSKLNKCIAALSYGFEERDWRGPVPVMSDVDDGSDSDLLGYYEDVVPEGGRVAQRIFVTCGPILGQRFVYQLDRMLSTSNFPETIRGVIISCKGDQHFLRKHKYVEIQVSKNDGIFKTGAVSEITKHMGIPLYLQKRPRNPALASKAMAAMNDGSMPDPDENGKACFLMLSTNTDLDLEGDVGTTWGLPHTFEWDCGLEGSVLVVRKDGKDISPHQVETLTCYCEKLASQMVGGEGAAALSEDEAMEYDEEKERKIFIEEMMCQSKFEEFFKDFKREKVDVDGSWDAEISPFSA